MTDPQSHDSSERQLAQYLSRLSPERQREVVDFARFLTFQEAEGAPLKAAWESLAGTLPDADARELEQIIADGCEKVDAEGW